MLIQGWGKGVGQGERQNAAGIYKKNRGRKMGHFHSLHSQRDKSPDVAILHKQGLYTEKTLEKGI